MLDCKEMELNRNETETLLAGKAEGGKSGKRSWERTEQDLSWLPSNSLSRPYLSEEKCRALARGDTELGMGGLREIGMLPSRGQVEGSAKGRVAML